MATKLANRRECNYQTKEDHYDWKYTKIPIDQVYEKKVQVLTFKDVMTVNSTNANASINDQEYKKTVLKLSPSYKIKDFEDTITVNSANAKESVNLLSSSFFEGFITKEHKFVHLGLVQIAVNPLMRDGIGAPVVVSLRDARQLDFHKSLLALVKVNLSLGPFNFECFPSFSVSLDDASLFNVLTLDVETGGVHLALTYRVVCKAMVDLSPEALKKPVLGKTVYVQPASGIHGATIWDQPESSTNEQDPNLDDHVLEKDCSISSKSVNEQVSYHATSLLDEWKHAKIPVKKVYKSTKHNMFKVLDSFRGICLRSNSEKGSKLPALKEYEKTLTLNDTNDINVRINLLEGLVKNKVKNGCYLHLGLFQVAIKPLTIDDELRAPIVVCVRDTRFKKFYDSLIAVVEANVCEGPFYFNCSPNHPIDARDYKFFTLTITTRVPLVLTYRVVCYVSTTTYFGNVTSVYREPTVRGETTYYHPLTGTERTTNWDDVQVLKSSKV